MADSGDDGGDAMGDGVVGVVDVVGANEKHDDMRLVEIELAVVEPPENVLRPIAADAEIDGRVFGKMFVPYIWGEIEPEIGD